MTDEAGPSELRQQVSQIYSNLINAVDKLEHCGGTVPNQNTTSNNTASRQAGSSTGVASEIRRLFHFQSVPKRVHNRAKGGGGVAKRKRLQQWQHTFLCLARKDQVEIPYAQEKGELKLADLGEKKCLINADADPDEFDDTILDQFPKLRNTGGYELLRQGNNKSLELIIPPKDGYSVDYLKSIVTRAKLYIRPIQTNLDLSTEVKYLKI